MRIGDEKKITKANNLVGRSRLRKPGGLFQVNANNDKGQVIATPAAQSINHIGALLSAQEVDANQAKQQLAVKRGSDMLDLLDKLKIGLLSGRLAPQMLRQLSILSSEQNGSLGNEGLDGILQSIELRSKVELAKLAQQKS